MVTDISKCHSLAVLDALAGNYSSERLSVEVQSLGHGGGIQVRWRWAGPTCDIGLIGMGGDGRLVLGYLSNSQPWWGSGFFREFMQDEVVLTEDYILLRFQWAATNQPSAAGVERISLEFNRHKSMIFSYEIDGTNPIRRKWELTPPS